METFFISRLDTDLGLIRINGMWDPLTDHIQITELAIFEYHAGWTDASFWLTEQEHEVNIASVINACRRYLASSPPHLT